MAARIESNLLLSAARCCRKSVIACSRTSMRSASMVDKNESVEPVVPEGEEGVRCWEDAEPAEAVLSAANLVMA